MFCSHIPHAFQSSFYSIMFYIISETELRKKQNLDVSWLPFRPSNILLHK
jgi:hypothetical protein